MTVAQIKVFHSEIHSGRPLPWPIFDKSGRMLLNAGEVIASDTALEALLKRGMYRKVKHDGAEETHTSAEEKPDPFNLLLRFTKQLLHVFMHLERGNADFQDRVLHLCDGIQDLCATDADAVIGAIHLYHEPRYSLIHSVYTAALCELVGQALQWEPQRRRTVIAAALTSNVAIRDLQDRLSAQKEPLTEAQQKEITLHPGAGAAMLKQSGITDALWLETVQQHHERVDGQGYYHLAEKDIRIEAKLLSIADRYCAMVSPREYKPAVSGQTVLRELLLNSDKQFDHSLCHLTIKTLGIYPPGTFVKLANGEIAIVIRRDKDHSLQPTVYCVKGPRGNHYSTPLRRDCNEKNYAIKEACVYDGAQALNLVALWSHNRR